MRQRFVNLLLSPLWVGIGVGLVSFVVYLRTLAPTVGFIDSGELAAVACTLGIAHPTGYPLFTLLGWMFSKLPTGGEEIVRLNIMAAFFCSAGIVFFFHFLRLFLSVVFTVAGQKQTAQLLLSCAGASFMLAFSETYWSQAVTVEVYSLHALFLSLLLFSFMKASSFQLQEQGHETSNRSREEMWWFLFAFILGLSFTNHMTTILLAPGMLYSFFALHGARGLRLIGKLAFPFLAGASVYLYLPFRSSQEPLFDWGDPVTLERLFWHLRGKQYSDWMFPSTDVAGRQLRYFLTTLPEEFAYIGIVLAIVGAVALTARHGRLMIATLLFFVTCVLYSINYDIHDIDSYFLLSYLVIALFAGAGLFVGYDWFLRVVYRSKSVAGLSLLALGFIPLLYHYDSRDESSNVLVENYTRDMFESFEPNALVLSYQWDYWVSASYYYQYVKNLRPDVAVVDKELLRRSWYLRELERRIPWLIASSQREVDAFLKELFKFEHELPYDSKIIQSRFVEMVRSLITRSGASRPVYVTPEIEAEFTQGFHRVPQGLAYRLVEDGGFYPTILASFRYVNIGRTGRLEDMVRKLYVDALMSRGVYYHKQGGEREETRRCLRMALEIDPSSSNARALLGKLDGEDGKIGRND